MVAPSLCLLFLDLSSFKLGAKSQPATSRAEHELTLRPRAGGCPSARRGSCVEARVTDTRVSSAPGVHNRYFPLGISSDIVLRRVLNPYPSGSGINLSLKVASAARVRGWGAARRKFCSRSRPMQLIRPLHQPARSFIRFHSEQLYCKYPHSASCLAVSTPVS
jgi:hypothetical protein